MRIAITLFLTLVCTTVASAYETLAPKQADQLVNSGAAVLIDVRRPDEWAAKGIAVSAYTVDMSSPEFGNKLNAIIKANPGKKIALICEAGGRSAWLAGQLEAQGLGNIVDVAGGMGGNASDPGWIASGLPIRKP